MASRCWDQEMAPHYSLAHGAAAAAVQSESLYLAPYSVAVVEGRLELVKEGVVVARRDLRAAVAEIVEGWEVNQRPTMGPVVFPVQDLEADWGWRGQPVQRREQEEGQA